MNKYFLKSTPIFSAFLVRGFGDVSGLMLTAIIGGAFVPLLLFGIVSDMTSNLMAGFIVPALCMLYVFHIAFKPAKA